ncbi:MAG: CvpA family protein [Treponema sp.]|jgi:membrane protein required for colicin V production|nr:CvpA family protein [Treponema sp.]
MQITIVDIIFLLIIAGLAAHGYRHGVFEALAKLASPVLGVLGASIFYGSAAILVRALIPDLSSWPTAANIIAFIAIFLIIFVAIRLIGKLLNTVFKSLRLGILDKIFGLLFGIVEGIALAGLFFFLLSIQPFFDAGALLDKGILSTLLRAFIPAALPPEAYV